MGLEKLASVFSDLSKNALADNESLVSPDIGNQSGYRDISRNHMDTITQANSLVGDYHGDVNSFGRFSPNPIMDSVFANKSIQLTTGQSLIKDDEHTFGSKGNHDKLILIGGIGKGQIDSPMAKDVLDGEFTTLARRSVDVRHRPNIFGETDLKLYGEHSGEMINPDIRKKDLNVEIGKNNRLGEGDFVFDTLYNANQTAKTNRILIDTGRTTGGKKVTINTMAWSIGQAWSNMDIRSAPDGVRGNEPYIVNDIGITKGGEIESGNNRDLLPFNKSKEDRSRLSKFYYDTPIGTSFMIKENATGVAFSSVLSISPTKIWDGYPGKIDWSQPIAVIQKYIRDTLTNKVLNLANTSNLRLLATNIHLPPVPTPGWGNTGFLNFVNTSFQGAGGFGSIRRPGTLLLEYSNIVKSGREEGSKIYQLGVFTNIIDELNPVAGKKVREFNLLKRNPVSIEVAKNDPSNLNAVKDAATPRPGLPFLKFSETVEGVGLAKKKISSGVDDKIALRTASQLSMEKMPAAISSNDFYVKIKDLRNDKLIYFRGYVTGITENVNPSFSSTNYIGRSEPVYMYERAERDLSFNLKLYPNNEIEFDAMYEKIRYLTSLAYPQYMPDDIGLMRMKAPFTELYVAHIGSRKKGQFGFIKSLSYTVEDAGDWDVDTNLPRLFSVAISYQILNRKSPSINDEFYRLTA